MTQETHSEEIRSRTPAEVGKAGLTAVAAHDLDGIQAVGWPDEVDDFVAVGEFKGHQAIRDFFTELYASFPDFDLVIERITGDEKVAALQWRATGTFTGAPYQGIKATGRRMHLRGCDVFECEDGLIRRNTIYYDGAAVLRGMGLLPPQWSRRERALIGLFNVKTTPRRLLRRIGRKSRPAEPS